MTRNTSVLKNTDDRENEPHTVIPQDSDTDSQGFDLSDHGNSYDSDDSFTLNAAESSPRRRLLRLSPAIDPNSPRRSSFTEQDEAQTAAAATDRSQTEKPVTWSSLPKKGQLAILTFARLSEPLTQTSLQAYMFYQLRSFDPSLPDSTISSQAGILQGCFTAAQFLTAVFWGRLADSDWMGRKRVLMIGLFGTCVSCLGFGFSRSFIAAAVFRTIGGALNSNVGVMRTMIAEIIQEKKYQSRAFLILPMCFNVGVIIGPILGGILADPVKRYGSLLGPGSLLGGKDGVWWMQHWPYALPNVVSAIFIFASFLAILLGLDETHEVARYKTDPGRKLGKIIARRVFRRHPRHYEPLATEADATTSIDLEGSTGYRSVPPSPAQPRHTQPKKRNLRELRRKNVLLTLLTHFLLAFHTSAFNNMIFVFLPMPRMPPSSRHGLHFSGGLGLSSERVGLATAVIGLIGLPLQIFVYPRVQSYLGTLKSYRTFLPFSPVAYMLMPFLVLIPTKPWLVWPAFTIVVGLQVISRTFALPANIILVNNSVSERAVLGTLHGIAQSISSAARTMGPVIGGWGLGMGLKHNIIGAIWWALAAEALLGWVFTWTIEEGKGIERKPTTEEQR
ncbi:hypothetical protein DTO280E4_3528 [Paecilomyces variotii]|nr:hypothetical protein DTO169E5_608 [Paecilomyces variotii]KAJ9253811.1 hypothetical protein DTO207G8_3943 [Paecilomyces variotii]KAJ9362278.1 hypothetical protein DTO280E4_3528 [Paecilomyces variotii]KAJ9368377.1 hypothetical protein DTO282E5_6970 [Paecilomyces variotii]KAJ9392639.1 hypothetical protein DTO063F5_439 [Paecilomyces variotii]